MQTIGRFELIDHGIEGSDYFQGCGVSCTSFGNVVTGIGDNPAEAIDDCLEQIASGTDFNTEGMEQRILAEEGWSELPTAPSVTEEGYSTESYYHVSIRWN